MQRHKPATCDCCDGCGEKPCSWCNATGELSVFLYFFFQVAQVINHPLAGAGAMRVGEHVFCSLDSGCKPCPVCNSKVRQLAHHQQLACLCCTPSSRAALLPGAEPVA